MSRSYKNTVIAILLACILTMAIGYAVLNTRLSISGTSKITSDFNIQVTGISEFGVFGLASTTNMDFTPTSATYSANIQAPGDEAAYEIVIENKGSIPGYVMLEQFEGYDIYDDGKIRVGVIFTSKNQFAGDFNSLQITQQGINYLNPGEKLYVYADIMFSRNATSMPEQKTFSNTINFNFYTKDYFGENVKIESKLLSSVLVNNPVVTSGNGLYSSESSDFGTIYTFKSDADGDVNNYVSIDGKLWRIIRIYNKDNRRFTYDLVSVDKTVGTVFSNIKDSDGFYNNLSYSYSTLFQRFEVEEEYFFEADSYSNPLTIYVPNVDAYYGVDYGIRLITLNSIFDASTSSECDIIGLSNGKCKSWLTNDDTYLFAKVYSDETTNTGNIAYLQDSKVISVDPRDINYANARKAITIKSYTCDFTIINADQGDGSYYNPYIISMDENDWCESDT